MEKINKINDDQLDNITGGTKLNYQVQLGDTLDAIAKKFNTTTDQLMKWNPQIQNPNIIAVGQNLQVKF